MSYRKQWERSSIFSIKTHLYHLAKYFKLIRFVWNFCCHISHKLIKMWTHLNSFPLRISFRSGWERHGLHYAIYKTVRILEQLIWISIRIIYTGYTMNIDGVCIKFVFFLDRFSACSVYRQQYNFFSLDIPIHVSLLEISFRNRQNLCCMFIQLIKCETNRKIHIYKKKKLKTEMKPHTQKEGAFPAKLRIVDVQLNISWLPLLREQQQQRLVPYFSSFAIFSNSLHY